LEEALELVMLCEPHVVAHGHSIHSFRGNAQTALAEEKRLESLCGVPFITPSRAVGEALNFLLAIRHEEGEISEEAATARLLAWWQERS
jgi:hypothetical protein